MVGWDVAASGVRHRSHRNWLASWAFQFAWEFCSDSEEEMSHMEGKEGGKKLREKRLAP
jgi:hypothetical protein